MRSLAKILLNKDIIDAYCQALDYVNPRILYLSSSNCLNLVVDDINAAAYNDVLLENLLSDKLDCAVNVLISENFTDAFKDEAPGRMVSLENSEIIQSLYKKPYDSIMVEDRDSDEFTLERYEPLKKQIVEIFKAKGLLSPYAVPESKEISSPVERFNNKPSKREREKTSTSLFKGKKAVVRDEEKDHRSSNKRAKKVEEITAITKPSQFSRSTNR
jgi:hypothetical protein